MSCGVSLSLLPFYDSCFLFLGVKEALEFARIRGEKEGDEGDQTYDYGVHRWENIDIIVFSVLDKGNGIHLCSFKSLLRHG